LFCFDIEQLLSSTEPLSRFGFSCFFIFAAPEPQTKNYELFQPPQSSARPDIQLISSSLDYAGPKI